MLNAKSGIADLLQPGGGAGAARRQNTGTQDSSGLFGDTLKGQMDQAATQKPAEPQKPIEPNRPTTPQKPAAQNAAGPARPEENSDSESQAVTDSEASELSTSAAEAAETPPAADVVGMEEEAAVSEVITPVITFFPEMTAVEQEVASAGDGTELLAGAAEGGNILPPALPSIAVETADAALTGGAEDSVELPSWMHSLVSAGRGREQVATNRTPQEPVLAAEGEEAAPSDTFLKGLQAVTAQLDSQRGDNGSRQGAGQGAEALFKLAGLTVPKETVPPPFNMAASNVSAAATAAAAGPAPAAAQVQTLALDVPMRQAGWDQALSERVVWMAKQGVQEAQIHLNPRNMGPIEIHVSVQKEQATVAFVAHHAVTRDALEAAMPRLRDMLQDSGLNLAQSEVSQHDRQREQTAGFAGGQEQGQHGPGSGAANDEFLVAETSLQGGAGLGTVDYFA